MFGIIQTIRISCSITWITPHYKVCNVLEGYAFFLDQSLGVDDPFPNSNIQMSDSSRIRVHCCRKIYFCWKRRVIREISQSWAVPPRVPSLNVHHPQHGVVLMERKTNNEGDERNIFPPPPRLTVVNLPSHRQRKTLQKSCSDVFCHKLLGFDAPSCGRNPRRGDLRGSPGSQWV